MKKEKNYFIGLDIGTDSIGYAVADETYSLLKYKSEPMWGVHLFEEAGLGDERRAFRTARRRLDRRQHRVKLLDEIFASEISKVDPRFFIRKKESSLWRDDAGEPFSVFNDIGFTDKEYYEKYPTIHHLIWELLTDKTPHDVRLVYIAIAWLVAHRGHFLNEVSKENIKEVLDIEKVYETFWEAFDGEKPWGEIDKKEFGRILKKKTGVNNKYKELCMFLYGKNKAEKELSEEFPYSREGILKLLCGGSYSVKELFGNDDYAELSSIRLDMKDEDMADILSALGDDGELIVNLKAVFDWTVLSDILSDGEYISKSKIVVYDRHKKDLKLLKRLVKKYIPSKYDEVFRIADKKISNYVSYSGNFKSAENNDECQKTNKEEFCKYIRSVFKNVNVDNEDEKDFADMIYRLELMTFMPKQVDSDNRVLPYQIYWVELEQILKNASSYLPFLKEEKDGYTTAEKIISVFEFRVPYYVGPLNKHSGKSWVEFSEKKKIYPWNFEEVIDLDKSEQAFIDKMTNTCTYLPDCDVVPKNSFVYQRFAVLNEINCITVDGVRLSVELKQDIYRELFMKKKKVTLKAIKDLLKSKGQYTDAELENLKGIDKTINSSLSSYIAFSRLISSGILSEDDAEKIISRSTYSESKSRFALWLDKNYPSVSAEDKKYIRSLKFKDFGRLSKEFLCELQGADVETGETHTILEWMWETNQNLNELLSDNYSFREEIENRKREFYNTNKQTLSQKLDSMYVSNAVKRPIIRTLDIVSDIVKVCGRAPEKIFVEMARGSDEEKKRTKTRLTQLREMYAKIDSEDVRRLSQQLDDMGVLADNKLQSERLYLYYLQLGKCMYSGKPIELSDLSTKMYDVDHIYPQSKVDDDSILNNKALVLSTINAEKGNNFPIKAEIREKMSGFWKMLLDNGLMKEEKYKRLTRSTPFTSDEEWGFINRQLVETRQSTKVVAEILKEKYPDTQIVYVKAGMVSKFRQAFELLKCRSVNDLHHAKDAYLNIVVGNVYHECFTKKWFFQDKNNLSMRPEALFKYQRVREGKLVWDASRSLDKVNNIVKNKNAVHFTKYAFCRYGGFFDQMPLKAAEGLIPRKKDLPTEKYGGYNKTTASFFSIVKFTAGKKTDLWVMPVDLLVSDKFLNDEEYAKAYAADQLSKVQSKKVDSVEFPLGKRILKINTMFEFDGMRMTLSGKAAWGKQLGMSLTSPLLIGHEWETYIKKLERFSEKKKDNPNLVYMEEYDGINFEKNIVLYDILTEKLKTSAYIKRPANPAELLENGRNKFMSGDILDQTNLLLQVVSIFGRSTGGRNLELVCGLKNASPTFLSAFIGNWKKTYSDVRIVDTSASGLYETKSENLLDIL